MATRRSPRSIERFCNGLRFGHCDAEQTALLLSFTQCTGWSADRICIKLMEVVDIVYQYRAENLWTFHWQWIITRGGSNLFSEPDVDLMKFLLKSVGVVLEQFGRPLNHTIQPTTVKFMSQWSPKSDDSVPMVEGFTPTTRAYSKDHLAQSQQTTRLYATPTTLEAAVINSFGSTMRTIIEDILKRWAGAMRAKLRSEPSLRPIRDREHVMLIIHYLRIYQEAFETCFGMMEHNKTSGLGHIKDDTVCIQSTGYAAKLFLGLMMADRLYVIERLRRQKRELIGFAVVDPATLSEDSTACPICQDPLGIETPEGTEEKALQLVICCGQVIGENCLRTWLSGAVYGKVRKGSCPHCRYNFPTAFLEKLFACNDDKETIMNDDVDERRQLTNLVNPTASFQRPLLRREDASLNAAVLRASTAEGGLGTAGEQGNALVVLDEVNALMMEG